MINFYVYSIICRFKYYYIKLCKKVNTNGKFNYNIGKLDIHIVVNILKSDRFLKHNSPITLIESIHITPQLHINIYIL